MRIVKVNGININASCEAVVINSGLGEGGSCEIYVDNLQPEPFQSVETGWNSVLFRGLIGDPDYKEDYDHSDGILKTDDEAFGFKSILVNEQYNTSLGSIISAVIAKYAPGFTLVAESFTEVVQLQFKYTPLLEVLRGLAQQGGAFFHTTPDKTIYFFRETWGPTINLTDKQVVHPYRRRVSTLNMVNKLYVVGGGSYANITEQYTGDGVTDTFPLKYFPRALSVTLNGAPQQIGYEGFTNPPGVQVLVPTGKKEFKFVTKPPLGADIRASYQYEYKVMELVQDVASFRKYGRWLEGVISDTSILDKETARARARAQLRKTAMPKENLTIELIDFQPIYAGQRLYLTWLDRFARVLTSSITIESEPEIKLEVELL